MEVLSEGGYRLVWQEHQPVDSAQEFPDFAVGVAGVEQADRLFQTQVMEAIGLLTVALSGQMSGDEEPGAVVPMAGQVELFVEVEELADEVAELEAASGELDTDRRGIPMAARGWFD